MEENMQDAPSSQSSGGRGGMMWTILIIIVLIVGGYLLYQGNQDDFGLIPGDVLRAQVAGDTDEIILEEVNMPEGGGFVVVYEEQEDGTRRVVGKSSFLTAGKHTNVAVPVPAETKRQFSRRGTNERAAKYLAVAHQDSNEDGVFDPVEDEPFVDETGEEIEADISFEDTEDETATTQEDASDDTSVPAEEDNEAMEEDGAQTSDDEEAIADGVTVLVTYGTNGFDPDTVTVNADDTVRFVNESELEMWVGSAMHPTHEVYDGTSLAEHCPNEDNTSFDQCETGDEYSFTFTKSGEWGYHNHRNANHFGKVIVLE